MKIGLNILLIISILLIVCILMICLISYIENRKLVVTEYTIKNRRVPSGFQGFRIAQLSDLHNACFGPANEILFERLKCCEPDIIVVTGDMIVGKPDQDVLFAADTMNALCDIAPIYFSMGNQKCGQAFIRTHTKICGKHSVTGSIRGFICYLTGQKLMKKTETGYSYTD